MDSFAAKARAVLDAVPRGILDDIVVVPWGNTFEGTVDPRVRQALTALTNSY